VTGSRGSALLIARELTRSAVFEVAGPGGARSEPVRVVVVPLVTVSVSGTGSGGGTGQETVTVTASVAFGSPGDVVVLQRLTVSGWDAVREARATRDRTVAGGSACEARQWLGSGPAGVYSFYTGVCLWHFMILTVSGENTGGKSSR
jgi:hypothetical protein